jgi:hypothetical protein
MNACFCTFDTCVPKPIRIFTAAVVTCWLTAAAPAQALPVTKVAEADLGIGFAAEIPNATGLTNLYAFSTQSRPAVAGDPNANVSVKLVSNGAVQPPPNTLTLNGVTDYIGIRKKDKTLLKYGPPTIALRAERKNQIVKAGDEETLMSQTGLFFGAASQNQLNPLLGTRITATASAQVGPAEGSAAAEVYDPFTVSSSIPLAYDPTVRATLALIHTSDFAGVQFYALDSLVFPESDIMNFVELGSPFDQTLWSLSLTASGLLPSAAAVEVDFELNPLALTELLFPSAYLSALPGFTPLLSAVEIAALVNQEFENRIGQSLAFNDGTVTLDAHLFPAGMMFQPFEGSVVFATGAAAVLTTPEPGCLWLLGIGACMMMGARIRARSGAPKRDRHAMTGQTLNLKKITSPSLTT